MIRKMLERQKEGAAELGSKSVLRTLPRRLKFLCSGFFVTDAFAYCVRETHALVSSQLDYKPARSFSLAHVSFPALFSPCTQQTRVENLHAGCLKNN